MIFLSLSLLAVSFITTVEFVGEEHKEYSIPASTLNFTIPLNLSGTVEVRGEVPDGVRVYVLTRSQYTAYVEKGELPEEFLGDGREELEVRNPSILLIQNTLDREAKVSLHFKIYRERKPYAILSLPAFFLIVTATVLAWMRLLRMTSTRSCS